MSQALQAAFQGLGLQLPVVGQQQPAAEQEGGEMVPWSMYHDVQVYIHTTVHLLYTLFAYYSIYTYYSIFTIEHIHYLHTTVYLQYVHYSTYTAVCIL